MKNIGRIARIARVGRAGATPVPHGQVEFTTSGTGTWTVPTGVTSALLEAWGSGEGGNDAAGDGGIAGTYASAKVVLTPGDMLPYNVGAAYAFSGSDTDSYVLPVGGTHTVNDLVSAASGSMNNVGSIIYAGGIGGVGDGVTTGGGGGGAGGHFRVGVNGADGAAGGAGGLGGDESNSGGDAGAVTGNGQAGGYPGGGGGGGSVLGTGGAGADGRVRITWPV